MNNPKDPKLGHNKKTFLEKPVEHIDITSFDTRKIIESMDKMSFTSRDTAKASGIFNEMLSDNISLKIPEALAVSLDVNDILSIDVIIFRESKDVISMCSTGFSRKVFLL